MVESIKIETSIPDSNLDVNRGIAAVLDSLLIPTLQITENAGFDGLEIVEKQKHQPKNHGFDARDGEWVDLIKKGIIDPTRVSRNAILNASSIASLLITAEAAVIEVKIQRNIKRSII